MDGFLFRREEEAQQQQQERLLGEEDGRQEPKPTNTEGNEGEKADEPQDLAS